MKLPLTYGQCLRKIMQSNRLSITTLSRKMGYHSPTQLSRILNDDVSPALITKFHHQFMLIFDWLISPAEIKSLSTSLQFSCLGEEQFLTRRSMYRMLFDSPHTLSDTLCLRIHPAADSKTHTLSHLMASAEQYVQIDMLVLGSAFDTLLPRFAELIQRRKTALSVHIQHAFILEEKPAQVVSRISALVPYLNTPTYTGVYCTQSSPEVCSFLQQNQLIVSRCRTPDGKWHTRLFTVPQKDGVSLCRLEGDTLYTFYEQQINAYKDHLRPIKSVYPQPKTARSLLTLLERDLFLEKDRTCCFVRLDLCFHALPIDVVRRAVDNGARLGMEPDDPLLLEMCRVHEARYHNLLYKEAPTCILLSRAALLTFAETGHMSDHLYAMRDFTPLERRMVLVSLLDGIRQNPALHVHFFREDTQMPVSAFAVYKDMGMQVSANNTAYDLSGNHSEVFVGLPEFADTFIAYCMDTLIPEHCLDRDESIAWLNELIARLDAMMNENPEE